MPPQQNDTETHTEQLGFRVTPEVARKVRAVAAMEDVPYADLLRDKAREIADRYDRIIEMVGSDKLSA